jgi:hypothetical protein
MLVFFLKKFAHSGNSSSSSNDGVLLLPSEKKVFGIIVEVLFI